MAVVVIMPKQGQSVESCIITEIRKKKGDTVAKGDILFSYETDKASFEEESPADGVVLECFYNDGDEVPVLKNMMVIGQPGEDYSSLLVDDDIPSSPLPEDANEKKEEEKKGSDEIPLSPEPDIKTTAKENNSFLSPRAKKLAKKEAVDTLSLQGTGPGGRVIERDIKAALEKRPALTPLAKKVIKTEDSVPAGKGSGLAGAIKASDLKPKDNPVYSSEYKDEKISNVRKIIAKSMYNSLQNSAQLTHHLGADARNIQSLRAKIKKAVLDGSMSENITLNDMVCFAVIKALKKYPKVNSHFLGDKMRIFNKVNLGLAVDTDRGLMVPVVKNADDLSITGLSSQLKELAAACKKGGISPELLSPEAASFTVSNLGNYGVEIFTPVINLPQAAILGVNTIIPRPKDLGGGVYGFVPYLGLSLTYDHRALDGGEATRFLKQVATEIENLELNIFNNL